MRSTRRKALQGVGFAGAAWLLGGQAKAAEEAAPKVTLDAPKIVKPSFVEDGHISVNVSQDRLAMTVIFDNFQAETIRPQEARTATPHRMALLQIPIGASADSTFVGATLDLRGYIDKPAGSQVLISVAFLGTQHAFEFPVTQAINDSFEQRRFSLKTVGIGESIPALLAIMVSITSGERQDPVLVHVDDLNVELLRWTPEQVEHKKKRPAQKKRK